jgi:Amylo-alpha-1,6-glucosidase
VPASADRARYLTSLASTAIFDACGDLELPHETRGALVEWGGAYGQAVRLTGPWRLRLLDGEQEASLGSTFVRSSPVPGGFRSEHRWRNVDLVHEVAALPDPPGVLRSIRLASAAGSGLPLRVASRFEPFLFPVAVEGVQPTRFRVESVGGGIDVTQRIFGLRYRSTVPALRTTLDGASWEGGTREGPVREVGSEHDLGGGSDRPGTISWMIAGGLRRTVSNAGPAFDRVLADPAAAVRAQADADDVWLRSTPVLNFPEAPALEAAYGIAREGLRRLYCAPGEDLTGLRAGLPWYDAIWCRDVAWMLPAVLWLGDHEWAEKAIDSVFRFQGRSDVPILGGEAGELPMQIAPGPIFLYGTSDTSLYYPTLVERLLRHAGASAFRADWRTAIERILSWGVGRTDGSTGLLRNGGEVEKMDTFAAAITRIRFGIDAPDTTIWDSADRRDHAIDVQVLWWQALRSAQALLPDLPGAETRARQLATTIGERYWWPEEGYLFDTLREGRPGTEIRPNALRAVSAGLVPPDRARSIVDRALRDDLTTDWGLRTLSARDPGYRPQGYHQGQVWPIATAWAADAAFAAGATERGIAIVERLARQLVQQGGLAHECFRGDRDEPFDSCFLLGFSLGPFLGLLFERIWGLSLDAATPSLSVRPAFPAGWRAVSLDRLRIGEGHASLRWNAGTLCVAWTGARPLHVVTVERSVEVAPGGSVDVPAPIVSTEP